MHTARGTRTTQLTRRAQLVRSPSVLPLVASIAATAVAVACIAAGIPRHPLAALVSFAVCAFAVCASACGADLRRRPLPALVTGPICWLFLNGLVIHRYGRYGGLHWDGTADTIRLAVLTAAGICGGATAVLASLVRRTTTHPWAVGRYVPDPSRSLEPWEPHMPPLEETWFWN